LIVTTFLNTNIQVQTLNFVSKIVRKRDLNISITLISRTRFSSEKLITFLLNRSLIILFKKIVNIERVANLFQELNSIISIVKVCQLLLEKDINNNKKLFVVLSLVKKDRFYTHCIYLQNKVIIIAILDLVFFSYYLLTKEDDKFKLIDSKIVVEQVAIY